ncbi:MAG TPA: GNAT family N-acetyltransferase [Pyrinomonadaceae bacterium]|nr:GNAT family N-acetyltransferase [Pyrinomonadaceae bacterium]
MTLLIEGMALAHWQQVRQIYQEGVDTGLATFERQASSWEKWDQGHLPFARLVAVSDGVVKGWAALGAVSVRPVYSGVAEVSVYVGANCRGQGVGRLLLEQLIAESEKNAIWTLQASIFPENESSIKLHRRCGFREVGIRRRIAQLNGAWRDTVLLERRSSVAGTD